MIQPIDRETTLQILTDAGCPNGYLASFALHHPQWDWMQHALNAAVAHSRKDAERYHMKRSIDLAKMLSLESLRESLPEMESVLTEGFLASYDLSIDAAIDAARAKP